MIRNCTIAVYQLLTLMFQAVVLPNMLAGTNINTQSGVGKFSVSTTKVILINKQMPPKVSVLLSREMDGNMDICS